ncbi:hypothetical protein MATL_G00255570 [Megalops atlanticus]|uniref:Uncharacterized protein n=1 Tax=Megalops atlanticus TaxID=7932 RepID=A0A9D3PCE3_MEGAT|nr:hypothetical protein MATL_G00255570 [Megalops atlanticus]
MSNCVPFHAQLASIMEVLAKAAVAEICELVDDGYAVLRLEISRRQKENEALKKKLHMMEMRMARGSIQRPLVTESPVNGQSGGARVYNESRGTASGQTPVVDDLFCKQPSISLWRDGETTSVNEEQSPLQSIVREESADVDDGVPESPLIKKETLEEDLGNGDAQGGLRISEDRSIESGTDGGERVPVADTQTAPAVDTEELTEQHSTSHSRWEDSGLDTILKAEPANNAAIAEICALVDDGYAALHVELSRSKNENEGLKRKLQTMELRIARGSVESTGRSNGAPQVCSDRTLREEGHFPAADSSVGGRLDRGLWKDGEPPAVNEDAPVQSDLKDKPKDIEEADPATLMIKKEGPEEDFENSDSQGGLKSRQERSAESKADDEETIVDTKIEPAIDTRELNEQCTTGHSVWEDSGLDTVLKKENEALKRKLRMMEMRIERGSWARAVRESCVNSRSSGVQRYNEFRGTAREENHFPAAHRDFSVGSQLGVSLWGDGEPAALDEEDTEVISVVQDKPADIEEARLETMIIKKEGLEEDLENSDPQGGLKSRKERVAKSGSDDGERAPNGDTQTAPEHTEELTEQHRPGQSAWKDSALDTVLKGLLI